MSKWQKITNHLLISALPSNRDTSYFYNNSHEAANATGKEATYLWMSHNEILTPDSVIRFRIQNAMGKIKNLCELTLRVNYIYFFPWEYALR